MDFVDRLNGCLDFTCVFELVKSAVETTIGRRRVGLILGLSKLPDYIGAMHQLGSNFIIMNRSLLERILQTENRKLINAYIFHILLHEYIHSLGYVNEQETNIIVHAISEKVLGPKHPATLIARYGIASVFANIPKLNYYNNHEDKKGEIEIVKDIENENLNYFG